MLFSFSFLILYFFVFLVLLGLWWFRQPKEVPALTQYPPISILIAARNEEEHIITCLQAIDRLRYPKDKLQVLVGDDRSTDSTLSLVEAYQKSHSYVTVIPVKQDLPHIQGKANVLAQLAQKATGAYFFITDADIEVPSLWAEAMLRHLSPGSGIVTGITTTKGHRLFDRLQFLDWLYNLGLMQVVSDRGLPVSTMGNNMLVTREAYEAVGGYEKIPFSVTEDVQLLSQVLAKGYTSINVYSQEVLALSVPIPDLLSLLHQRRRWMRGSVKLPWYMLLLFVIHASYYPVWFPLLWQTSFELFAGVLLGKVLLQSIFVHNCLKQVGQKTPWLEVLFLEVYLFTTSVILIVYFFLPLKIKWKGRYY